MLQGLTLSQLQLVAYQYARNHICKGPSTWDTHKCAESDCVYNFRTRTNNINLRKPENIRIARSV